MIRRLRRRFIRIATLSVTAVMLLLVRVTVGKLADKRGEGIFVYSCNAAMLAAFLLLALTPGKLTFCAAAVLAGYAFGGIEPALHFGERGGARVLKITIPENLDYEELFDDLFEKYTRSHELVRVRTTNMGTLFELTYLVSLKSKNVTKEFIDAIRCRNGNLNIICGRENDRDLM